MGIGEVYVGAKDMKAGKGRKKDEEAKEGEEELKGDKKEANP